MAELAGPHRVVVVGGGFGGLHAARSLRDAPVAVTLIDRRNFHLFQPLLYQVATGALSPGEIAAPLRSVFRRQPNVTVVLGEVVAIDVAARTVRLAPGEGEDRGLDVPYDTLVVTAGSSHSYFGREEWEAHAPGLKSLEDALDLRARVLGAFEAAEREPDEARRATLLRFVIVGGGPTGVELAGQIAEIARRTLREDFRVIEPEAARITVVEAGPRILSGYHPRLSASAARSLERLGAEVRTDTAVTAVDAAGVTVEGPSGPERIDARTTIWAAGVTAAPLARTLAAIAGVDTDGAGRLPVNADLTLPGHPEILVLGDMITLSGERGDPLPAVAQVAMQQGRHAARVIRERLAGAPSAARFRYRDPGNMATIGRGSAIAEIGRLRISGVLAWVMWLGVHIVYLIGFQNRIIVLVRWAGSFFTYGRGARLITGRRAAR